MDSETRLQGGQKEIVIPERENGVRIDRVVAELLPELSRSLVQKIIASGGVRVDGRACGSQSYRVAAGETVTVDLQERDPDGTPVPAEDIPLDIVYEDEDVIVVNKPRGMVVHPGAGSETGTLENALRAHCGEHLSRVNGDIRRGIVHRIDKDTSGLLVAAKNDRAHEHLAKQFFDHTITRKYYALVYDDLKQDTGTIDLPIGRDPGNRLRRAVNGIGPKRAVTHYRVLERFGRATYVECTLETGRTHQIRVHMAAIHHPLVGDPLYGSRRDRRSAKGQYLHAGVLGFVHPRTEEYMEFTRPLPSYFQERLDALRRMKNGRPEERP